MQLFACDNSFYMHFHYFIFLFGMYLFCYTGSLWTIEYAFSHSCHYIVYAILLKYQETNDHKACMFTAVSLHSVSSCTYIVFLWIIIFITIPLYWARTCLALFEACGPLNMHFYSCVNPLCMLLYSNIWRLVTKKTCIFAAVSLHSGCNCMPVMFYFRCLYSTMSFEWACI